MTRPAGRRGGGIRDKVKANLGNRTQESYKTRDDKGTAQKNFFDPDKMNGVSTWWPQNGDHIIDIIPYLAGVKDPKNKEGEATYLLDIWVHNNVGPTNEKIVCPDQFGKPCPICMERDRRRQAKEDWETRIKPLKPSRRNVYNAIVRDNGEQEKKGVQVFEIAHFFMEKHLSQLARNIRTGDFIVFSDPDDGRSICFNRKSSDGNVEVTGHKFEPRPTPITDAELEEAYCLDDLLLIRSYDEIADLFNATPAEGEGEGSEDTGHSIPADVTLEVDALLDMSRRDMLNFIEENQLGINARGVETEPLRDELASLFGLTLPPLEPEQEPEPPPEPDPEPEPEPEPEPPPPSSRRRRTEPEPPPEQEEQEQEPEPPPPSSRRRRTEPDPEPEPEPAPAKTSAGKASGKCPDGGKFGVECDDRAACDGCPAYDDCATIAYGPGN